MARWRLRRDARPNSLEVLKSLATVRNLVARVFGDTHETEICKLLSEALSQDDFPSSRGVRLGDKLLIYLVQLGGFEPPTS